jgi:hypothetical protein
MVIVSVIRSFLLSCACTIVALGQAAVAHAPGDTTLSSLHRDGATRDPAYGHPRTPTF